jgi:AraC family transcriptional regulator
LEWLQRMSNAIDYIEKHLEEPFDVAKIAQVACSSSFHFQRMFHMLTGDTLVEYIRKRRLTLAAQELAVKKVKVIDIALKYGYETPESFAKAFKRIHGVSPTAARLPGMSLKAFPRISFQLSVKGNQNMEYKIVEEKSFQVVGKVLSVSTKDVENFKRIPQFWKECNSDGTCEKLCRYFQATEILGVCMDMEYEKEQFVYMIAAKKSRTYTGSEFVEKTIPASNWAVFTSVGPLPNAIQRVWEGIFQEWFPATGYEHAVAPELEIYPDGDMNGEDYQCEVWIPIVKK